jgi:hypothetical protein
MVFAEGEANAIADELAARARTGELEPDFEAEGPKTMQTSSEEQEDSEADAETHFEISLDAEEEIPDVFSEEITAVPEQSSLSLEKFEKAAVEEEKLEVEELELELDPVEFVPAQSPSVEQPTPEPTPVVMSAESEVEKFAKEDGDLLQEEPAPVSEPVAEVSKTLPPSTTTERTPSPLEQEPVIAEPTLLTTEIPPSSVEEGNLAHHAPVVTDASIPVDTTLPELVGTEPAVGESAANATEKAEDAPASVISDTVPASTTENTPLSVEAPKEEDVKVETWKGDVTSQSP